MNVDDLLTALGRFSPEQVILTNRWPDTYRNAMKRALGEDYVRIYVDDVSRGRNPTVPGLTEVYVLRTVLDGPR